MVLPKFRGRQFSIPSGGELKNSFDKETIFELLAANVMYKTVIREGAPLPCRIQIQVALHKASLGVSESEANHPVIMVGPGTGLEPMRSLTIHIRGSSQNMPRGVPSSLIEAFKNICGLGQAAAEAYLLGMETEGRYRQATW